jgi:Stealth protein CR2, conserved region 2/Stealth protein CR1, conserved region 1
VFDIDAVITWVDGADPELKRKRDHYLSNASTPLHDNGTNPHRWVCSDELNFCLRSIANNAPWVRRVWIVTDNQIPDIAGLSPEFAAKIAIVDHRQIFAGFEDALPTFNSLAIETMLWRIPGLAEHFLYFNDDVFLTAVVEAEDFFDISGPVLRGKWANYAHLPDCDESRDEASLLNHYNQINAARMIGYNAGHIFASAHSVHPLQRSTMATLFDDHRAAFVRNSAYRFRCTEQFLPQSLHNHACIRQGRSKLLDGKDTLHVAVGAFEKWSADDVHAYLSSAERHLIKVLCVNDLPDVERNFPEARAWIEEAIGG